MKLAGLAAVAAVMVLALSGCSLKGHYSHDELYCTMNDGRYQVDVDVERATGADHVREQALFQRLCAAARGIARPTHYEGPTP